MTLTLFEARADLDQLRIRPTNAGLIGTGKLIGYITPVAGSALVDGEIFSINDGTNDEVIFEFDTNNSVVITDTLRKLLITGSESAADIRDLIVGEINDATLNVTAEAYGSRVKITSANRVLLSEHVTDGGFTVENSPPNDYVFCLGSDLLLPPVEDYEIGDVIKLSQVVPYTAGVRFICIQAKFRQPANLLDGFYIPDNSTVSRYVRTGYEDTTVINTVSSFFSSSFDDRNIVITGGGVNDGTYKIAKGGWDWDAATGRYIASDQAAVIMGNGPLSAAGGPTALIGYCLGGYWKFSIHWAKGAYSATIFTYDFNPQGTDKRREIRLPDLCVRADVGSNDGTLTFILELALRAIAP